MKVLVADNDTMTRVILARHLEKWGFEPVTADDGESAWEALGNDDHPRIAILDWEMPGIDGIEICERLRNRPHDRLVYVILLTAKSSEDDMALALKSGAHSFVTKPVSEALLCSHVSVGCRLITAEDRLNDLIGKMEAIAEDRAHQLLKADQLARTDCLTGVKNRRGLYEVAEAEIRRAQRYSRPLSLIAFDIDHFKGINDSWGHDAGDDVLRDLARVCADELREGDTLGRIGGDEFVVLLPETKQSAAVAVAERVRQSIEEFTFSVGDSTIQATVSVGIASLFPIDGASVDVLMKRADEALYVAKGNGRNRCARSPEVYRIPTSIRLSSFEDPTTA